MALRVCGACGLRQNGRKMIKAEGSVFCIDLQGCNNRLQTGEVAYQAVQALQREEAFIEHALKDLDASATALLA